MIRILIGSIVGGLAQFFVGFIFWGLPFLSRIPFTIAPDPQNAAVQTALAQNLTATGTGTYYVPWPDSAAGTVLHGRGPVALIFFNTHGFASMDTGSLVVGLILSIATMLLLGLALHAIAARVLDFPSRARIVVLTGVATVLYFTIAAPVYNYYMPWGYWIYLGLSQLVGWVVGGLILARWFVPRA
ncbi:hypothetical protein [Sphingomonas oligoaromativorans]|uniref:hypothetical protein n=1 Tax=Sphingomonas oligoaromativorans TaxID=575322 RepID=UPI0014248C47|nr:hypothetical protein [Sphingomonas oligoaromativorans]NIJ34686.1 hypothetical protein [Sphingomonas oligoaromativorans]